MNARDIMTVGVVTVSPDHGVRHAVGIMCDRNISGLPVVNDQGRLVGILTEGDLLRRAELGTDLFLQPGQNRQEARDHLRAHSWKVGDVMATDVVTVGEDTPVGKIAALMVERGVKRLPVLRDGALVGIVTRADLLRAIAVARPEPPIKEDDAIRRSVLARIGEVAELRESDLRVIVSDGVVHLWGQLPSEPARQAARAIAEGVRGTAGVVDHVTVVPDAPSSPAETGLAGA